MEVPVWEGFWIWLDTLKPLGGSLLEKAVTYASNHRDLLENSSLTSVITAAANLDLK